jgi:hypothetical protein
VSKLQSSQLDRTSATDPETKVETDFFHPREDEWDSHFEWKETILVGLTAKGRVTIDALNLNHPRRQKIRSAEATFNLFPPA